MTNTWFSSDWHLGHKNLVLGTTEWEGEDRRTACRNFKTLQEHDETLIANINDNVKKDDHLYFLGDFSFGGLDNIWFYRKQINCDNIHFVGGNHDHHIRRNKALKIDDGYVNAQYLFNDYNEILEKKIGKEKFVMCHYPMRTWHKSRSAIMLYGHVHGNLHQPYFDRMRTMDVGIDTHPEFRPYHIGEIRAIMSKRDNYENFTDVFE
jgi:calcineurin-like phosphoesterase family protein